MNSSGKGEICGSGEPVGGGKENDNREEGGLDSCK